MIKKSAGRLCFVVFRSVFILAKSFFVHHVLLLFVVVTYLFHVPSTALAMF